MGFNSGFKGLNVLIFLQTYVSAFCLAQEILWKKWLECSRQPNWRNSVCAEYFCLSWCLSIFLFPIYLLCFLV